MNHIIVTLNHLILKLKLNLPSLDLITHNYEEDLCLLLKYVTQVGFTKEILKSLSGSLTQLITQTLGESEEFGMIIFKRTELKSIGVDTISLSLFTKVKNVGVLSGQITTILSSKVTQLFNKLIGVKPSHIYLEFQNLRGIFGDGMGTHWVESHKST